MPRRKAAAAACAACLVRVRVRVRVRAGVRARRGPTRRVRGRPQDVSRRPARAARPCPEVATPAAPTAGLGHAIAKRKQSIAQLDVGLVSRVIAACGVLKAEFIGQRWLKPSLGLEASWCYAHGADAGGSRRSQGGAIGTSLTAGNEDAVSSLMHRLTSCLCRSCRRGGGCGGCDAGRTSPRRRGGWETERTRNFKLKLVCRLRTNWPPTRRLWGRHGNTEAQPIDLDDDDEPPVRRRPQQASSAAPKRQKTAKEVEDDVELAKKENNFMELSDDDEEEEPVAAASAPATSAPAAEPPASVPSPNATAASEAEAEAEVEAEAAEAKAEAE
eukprot:scaffold69374_cov57-Phaeocystis_antarctica.AAC.5